MGKVGRPKTDSALVRVAEVVTKAMPPAQIAQQVHGDVSQSTIVLSGQAERVVWWKMCAWTNAAIARALNVTGPVVDRYVLSSHFAALYEQKKPEFLGRVLEEMQGKLLEVGLEALEVRVKALRDPKTNKWLRDKIARELMELAIEVGKARGPSGEVGDKLMTVLERIKRRKLADGSTEIEKIRVTGPAGEAAETLAAEVGANLGARPHDAGGGGDGAGVDAGPGEARGEGGAGEDPAPA